MADMDSDGEHETDRESQVNKNQFVTRESSYVFFLNSTGTYLVYISWFNSSFCTEVCEPVDLLNAEVIDENSVCYELPRDCFIIYRIVQMEGREAHSPDTLDNQPLEMDTTSVELSSGRSRTYLGLMGF